MRSFARRLIATLLLCACALTGISVPAQAQQDIGIVVVSADSSLSLPLSRIARDYARTKGIAVTVSYLSSGPLSAQHEVIENATVDLMLTARRDWQETLKQQGLVDVAADRAIATNRLVLVGPSTSALILDLEKTFNTGKMLLYMGDNRLFAIANPETLAEGSYSREALRKMNADADLEPYTVYPRDMAQLTSAITRKGAYGLMLASTAEGISGLRIIATIPSWAHSPIAYHTLVLAGENMNAARAFAAYLVTPRAQAVFRQFGMGGI